VPASYCVQHHPARSYLLKPLLERFPGFELVTDPDPDGKRSPLRTYLECLRRTPPDVTHRVVIQDDAWPCLGFREKADAALAERPESIVVFFVPGLRSAGARRMTDAVLQRESWVNIGGTAITPLVATAWPVHLIEDFIRFATSARISAQYSHDDPVATLFVKKNKLDVWATVPSLVEHPDVEPSLIGKDHSAGANRNRVAAFYIDN
jgi:hypothetical protein